MRYPIAIVRWQDSEASNTWDQVSNVLSSDPKTRVDTLGFLLRDDEEWVVIASSVGEGGEDCNLVLSVPRRMVDSVTVLNRAVE